MISSFLIQDQFSEFDFNCEQDQMQNQEQILLDKINLLRNSSSPNDYCCELIEEIDDNNYNLFDQEIKYKIFEDISSVTKQDEMIELVLDIPVDKTIISINKIKLSNKLNKYIKDIFVCAEGEKIITYKDFINSTNLETSVKFTQHISSQEIIDCQFNKNITLHILMEKNVINKIINKNIFVNYSFAIFKPKLKFIF